MPMSAENKKRMALKGPGPITSEIVINNKILEQFINFKHLGNIVSHVSYRSNSFIKITGIIKSIFKTEYPYLNSD